VLVHFVKEPTPSGEAPVTEEIEEVESKIAEQPNEYQGFLENA